MVTKPEVPPHKILSDRVLLKIDRVTPLEDQFAALAAEGKIRGDWWRGSTSKNYPTDLTRPAEITLAEAHFNKYFRDGHAVKAAVAGLKNEGVLRDGDPYEFVAWLHHNVKAGLEYPIAALHQAWSDLVYSKPCMPYAHEIDGTTRHVHCEWMYNGWADCWRFLVVCEPK